jgi:hypothetical protein
MPYRLAEFLDSAAAVVVDPSLTPLLAALRDRLTRAPHLPSRQG